MFDCPRIILEKPEAWAFQLHPDPEGRTAWILAMLAFLLVKKTNESVASEHGNICTRHEQRGSEQVAFQGSSMFFF